MTAKHRASTHDQEILEYYTGTKGFPHIPELKDSLVPFDNIPEEHGDEHFYDFAFRQQAWKYEAMIDAEDDDET